MATHLWTLKEIDDDGSTLRTRRLSDNGLFLTQHVPNENADTNGIVTETINVLFEDYGGSTAREISQEVREYLALAEEYSPDDYRIYLTLTVLDSAEVWRSPVIGGVIEWGQDALGAYSSGYLQASIIIQRHNWWERHDAEETLCSAVSMTNNGTSYASLSDPGGTLPTPLRVELTNNSSVPSRYFYLAIDSGPDHATASNYITLPGGTASWDDEQSYSDSEFAEANPPTTTESTPGRHLTYTFSKAESGRLRGEPYHVLIGISSQSGKWYTRAKIYFNVDPIFYPLTWTDEVYVEEERIIATNAIRIPPEGIGDDAGNIAIALQIRQDKATASTVGGYTIEWIQLMPAKEFRKLKQFGFTTAANDIWVDDGPNDRAYIYDTSESYNIPILDAYGKPLHAYPGKTSALRVVMDEFTTVNDSHQWDATVYCRPRRATL